MEKFDVMSFYGCENEELQNEYERMFCNMTQEDKQFLLKDLSARLPYKPMIRLDFQPGHGYQEGKMEIRNFENIIRHFENGIIATIKPYLRPMSSMTDEEENKYNSLNAYEKGIFPHTEEAFDWLLAHHFDYRGLIPMGLALEAPEDMYKQ